MLNFVHLRKSIVLISEFVQIVGKGFRTAVVIHLSTRLIKVIVRLVVR